MYHSCFKLPQKKHQCFSLCFIHLSLLLIHSLDRIILYPHILKPCYVPTGCIIIELQQFRMTENSWSSEATCFIFQWFCTVWNFFLRSQKLSPCCFHPWYSSWTFNMRSNSRWFPLALAISPWGEGGTFPNSALHIY